MWLEETGESSIPSFRPIFAVSILLDDVQPLFEVLMALSICEPWRRDYYTIFA